MKLKTALTFTQRQARRLRDKCADGQGTDSCAELVLGILGDSTPPLTERQAEQTAAAAALHFASSDCARCALELALLPEWLIARAERVEKGLRRSERGLAVCLARLKQRCDAGDHGGAS